MAKKNNIEVKEDRLNTLYVKRAVSKSKEFDAEIDRLKLYIDNYYYGSK